MDKKDGFYIISENERVVATVAEDCTIYLLSVLRGILGQKQCVTKDGTVYSTFAKEIVFSDSMLAEQEEISIDKNALDTYWTRTSIEE